MQFRFETIGHFATLEYARDMEKCDVNQELYLNSTFRNKTKMIFHSSL